LLALFGRAAFPPVIGANSAHLVSMWKALEDTPVPVRHDLEQLGSVAADIGRSVEGQHGAEPVVSMAVIGLPVRHSAMGGSSTATLRRGVRSSDGLHVRQLIQPVSGLDTMAFRTAEHQERG
jgi:hypothetical protein